MCELRHTSLVVQKMHRARERSKVAKIYPSRRQPVRSICRTRSPPQGISGFYRRGERDRARADNRKRRRDAGARAFFRILDPAWKRSDLAIRGWQLSRRAPTRCVRHPLGTPIAPTCRVRCTAGTCATLISKITCAFAGRLSSADLPQPPRGLSVLCRIPDQSGAK
jgi:hypothetical protein